MKSYVLKVLAFIALSFNITNVSAQSKNYVSNKHTITKANGSPTNVTNDKKLFFEIIVYSTSRPNDKGSIWIENDRNGGTYRESFRIFSIDLKENGIYNYWTIDIATDGQTVLFQVDLNSATPTITMKRYAPTKESVVLKNTIYYLE